MLLRRSRPASSEAGLSTLALGPLSLDLRSFVLRVEDRTLRLTPMEFDILVCLMNHPGEVVSSERLLEEVWGYPPGTGDPAAVRWHIKNLRAKLEPDPTNPTYIKTIPRYGYTVSLE